MALLAQSVANLNLRFQDAGLGDPNLQILTLNLSVNDKAKYFEMDLNVVQKF